MNEYDLKGGWCDFLLDIILKNFTTQILKIWGFIQFIYWKPTYLILQRL